VFLKTNAYELCVFYQKYGVSWRRYRDQDKFNLTILSEVTSTSFQSATCNKQAKLVLNAEEKSRRDSSKYYSGKIQEGLFHEVSEVHSQTTFS